MMVPDTVNPDERACPRSDVLRDAWLEAGEAFLYEFVGTDAGSGYFLGARLGCKAGLPPHEPRVSCGISSTAFEGSSVASLLYSPDPRSCSPWEEPGLKARGRAVLRLLFRSS